ncbi:MAG: hypothetical protein IT523_10510, partial [Burkholderiales bacterium]|nr:hypothetical protein [Burkholderiales bacterium]
IEELLAKLAPHNHALAVQLACIPDEIRGFGHVKERHVAAAKTKEAKLKAAFDVETLGTPREETAMAA